MNNPTLKTKKLCAEIMIEYTNIFLYETFNFIVLTQIFLFISHILIICADSRTSIVQLEFHRSIHFISNSLI